MHTQPVLSTQTRGKKSLVASHLSLLPLLLQSSSTLLLLPFFLLFGLLCFALLTPSAHAPPKPRELPLLFVSLLRHYFVHSPPLCTLHLSYVAPLRVHLQTPPLTTTKVCLPCFASSSSSSSSSFASFASFASDTKQEEVGRFGVNLKFTLCVC